MDYDRVFQQQAVLDPALKWEKLHPGIQASLMGTLHVAFTIIVWLGSLWDVQRRICALPLTISTNLAVHNATRYQ